MNFQSAEQEAVLHYHAVCDSLWAEATVDRGRVLRATRAQLGASAEQGEIDNVADRVCNFMLGAGRLVAGAE